MAGEWISVDERLPDDGQSVFTWNGRDRCIDRFRDGESESFTMSRVISLMSDDTPPIKPTHWQPLPEPPA